MHRFFYLVFGGLFIVAASLGISYVGSLVWTRVQTADWTALVSQPLDGTSIAGIKRYVRYSASQEEDLISSAASSMSSQTNKDGVTAAAYVVRNLSATSTVATKDADRLLPVASLTKLVTAAVAKRLIEPDTTVTITGDIMHAYGNTAQFRVGESFMARDLFYPLLMVSSNDAAEAFAQSYGRRKFIMAMNEFAQSIGAYRTYFADPSGLSPLNVSTANDMTLILDWLRRNDPDILAITDLKSKTVRAHTWVNPAHFLNWSNYLGGKNGYTDEADRTGAALFSMDGNKEIYAVVVLGSESRDTDVIKLLAKVGQ